MHERHHKERLRLSLERLERHKIAHHTHFLVQSGEKQVSRHVMKECWNVSLTKRGCCHGLGVNGGLSVRGGQIWASVIPAFVVVVFDIEAGEFGEANSQGTTGVVDVLTVERLKQI